ncbi:MAG: type VI secretion system baseplate subunit TssF [Niveispirillum sp.]|uniref:type VI secretion system baseplate subunit TssF n=1 Tax=Niveispirillum sp. TaxID=1917217 RepID=UPI003BA688B7
MNEELLSYYQRELASLRRTGRQFAERHPRVAGRLHLTADVSPDPHVERLIEATALLAARIQARIQDGVPEITQALLHATYPHLIQPVPARTILLMQVNMETGDAVRGVVVERGAELHSQPLRHGPGADQVPCRFVTGADTTLWPIEIAEIAVEPVSISPLRGIARGGNLIVRCHLRALGGASFDDMPINSLRLFLDGPPAARSGLYELLFSRLKGVAVGVVPPGRTRMEHVALPLARIIPVGFAEDEGVFAYDPRTPLGYRLLLEYLSFPDKFMFAEVDGLRGALSGTEAELSFVLDTDDIPGSTVETLREAGRDLLRLGCVPAINQFGMDLEPVRLNQQVARYPLTPDTRRPLAYEVHAIQDVTLVMRQNQVLRQHIAPLYAQHRQARSNEPGLYWHHAVEAAPDGAQESALSLSDAAGALLDLGDGVVNVHALCGNRDLASRLTSLSFGLARDPSRIGEAHALRRPFRPLRPANAGRSHWQLISHLSFNRLSLSQGGDAALRGLLAVHNLAHPEKDAVLFKEVQQQIDSLQDMSVRPARHRVGPADRSAWCMGSEVALTFDESDATGSRYLFAAVLERFLALHAAANSFTTVTALSQQRKNRMAQWLPRAGTRPLI